MLLRHKSLETVATLNAGLAADSEFVVERRGVHQCARDRARLQAHGDPLMMAFAGHAADRDAGDVPGRVFQLRIYESPSVKTGLKKIEMFNDAGEIKIFRETWA